MAKIAVENVADVYAALIRGAPDAYAREFGMAYDHDKVFYATTSTTWGAVISNMLKASPRGIPPELGKIKIKICPQMPEGRIDVGYEGYHGAVAVDLDLGVTSFADRARVPLVDAIKATLNDMAAKDLTGITVAASALTWGLLHGLDPRLDVTEVMCLGCRTAVVPTVPDGTFILTTATTSPRAVTIPLN